MRCSFGAILEHAQLCVTLCGITAMGNAILSQDSVWHGRRKHLVKPGATNFLLAGHITLLHNTGIFIYDSMTLNANRFFENIPELWNVCYLESLYYIQIHMLCQIHTPSLSMEKWINSDPTWNINAFKEEIITLLASVTQTAVCLRHMNWWNQSMVNTGRFYSFFFFLGGGLLVFLCHNFVTIYVSKCLWFLALLCSILAWRDRPSSSVVLPSVDTVF